MNLSRRSFGAVALAVAAAGMPRLACAAPGDPTNVVQTLYDTLLDVMKHGPELGFAGRYQKLQPAIEQAFDVPTMCKIAIGPTWTTLPTDKKNALLVAFDKFLVSTYAARFSKFGGQSFQVGGAKPVQGDRMLVDTKLLKSDGEPIELNYLLRKNDTGTWQVIDIYLAGAISQMTQMRSDFSEPLRQGGADGLIKQLDGKSKQLQSET